MLDIPPEPVLYPGDMLFVIPDMAGPMPMAMLVEPIRLKSCIFYFFVTLQCVPKKSGISVGQAVEGI